MHHFFEFVLRHWALCGLFILLISLLLFEETRSNGMQARLSPQAATQLINGDNAKILDIRSPSAFEKGHIIGAKQYSAEALKGGNNDKINKHKDRAILIVCANGQTSSAVFSKMKKQGFKQLAILAGGMSKWQQDNLPVIKGKK